VTDYLGQLVQRGRQPDNVIQPRLSSRFEPPRQARVETPTLGMSVERESPQGPTPADTPVDSVTESQRSEVPRGRSPRRGRVAGALSVDPEASVDQQPREERAASHVETRRIGARPIRIPGIEAGQPSRDAPVGRQEPRAAHTVETAATRRESEARALADPAPVPRVARMRKAPQIEEPTTRVAGRHSHDKPAIAETIAMQRDRRGEPRRPETTLEPRQIVKVVPRVGHETLRPPASKPIDLAAAEQSTGADAPTIHVTIGRVEIRASVAAPLSRKAQARPPAMSLEDYLKQRKGAARE